MKWSQIRLLVESKPVLLSSLALFAVPLTAKIWDVKEESIGLYFAAVLITLATIVYALKRPSLVTIDTLEEAFNKGWNTRSLVDQVKEVGLSIESIENKEALTQLKNSESIENFTRTTFSKTKDHIDCSRPIYRCTITVLLSIALFFLVAVNVIRFVAVLENYLDKTKQTEVYMAFGTNFINIGDPVEVEHEDGSGKPRKTKGTLLSPDDGGAVVVRGEDGKVVVIPKGKVYVISEKE